MERLTIRNSEGIGVLKQPYQCERCGDLQWNLPDLGNGSPIDRLAEYEDLEEQGKLYRGWIPCSESLPEEYKRCLVCLKNGDVFSAYYTISWGFQLALREIREDNPVIAWQPLPEPYKPEEEELGE